jgi:tol-pal system protein YbgF
VPAGRRAASLAVFLLALASAGCAMRSDVRRLEMQLLSQQREAARADSALTANLASIARLVQQLLDSLALQRDTLTRLRGDVRVELYNVQRQLVAIQELTGQSQQRLTELRAELERRSEQLAAALPAPGAPAQPAAPGAPATQAGAAAPAAPGAPAPGPAAQPGAEELIELSIQQLRRGSPGTARVGLAEFLRRFPQHARAVDAEFFSGEAWAAEGRNDSAAAAYQRVVQRYPLSPRAPTALYRLGAAAQTAGRTAEARNHFARITTAYPNSEEATLARERLRTLPPNR